ncbi:MAG: hypothetical protein NTV79_07260 [Candidatus Aureabacteria bacterium]|nr:hypothetical protein [Candidatus Auribacterota bacterium]
MRTIRFYFIAATILLSLTAISCSGGGGGGSGDDPKTGIISGTWEGTFSTSLVDTSSLTMTVSQDGNEFSGTYSGADFSGSLTGTITGNTITFDLDPSPDCPGDFDGSGAISGSSLTLTFSGADCLGSHRNGEANLSKK